MNSRNDVKPPKFTSQLNENNERVRKTLVISSHREEFQINANESQIKNTPDRGSKGMVPDTWTPELRASKARARRLPARDSQNSVVTAL